MYSETRFQKAKADLAYSLLHSPTDATKQIESSFLRSLLSAAATRGQLTPDDVYRAVESSGAFDLDLDEIEKDKVIAYLWSIGDSYIGALSRQQAQELRKLHKLCLRVMEHNDRDAMIEIAELI
jgi:hypothetical protein